MEWCAAALGRLLLPDIDFEFIIMGYGVVDFIIISECNFHSLSGIFYFPSW